MLAATFSDNVLLLTFTCCDAKAAIDNARRLTSKKKSPANGALLYTDRYPDLQWILNHIVIGIHFGFRYKPLPAHIARRNACQVTQGSGVVSSSGSGRP